MDIPFSQACENNKGPIFEILQRIFEDAASVLEIGSGTGQHAVFFARQLPHLDWQPSDLAGNLPGIERWISEIPAQNLRAPVELDVSMKPWPVNKFDGVFSANTAHIMPWECVEMMISGAAEVLNPGGHFCLYGPMNYLGNYTSNSNAEFDQWLKVQAPHQGIREFHELNRQALMANMVFIEDNPMPANNRLLVWQKT